MERESLIEKFREYCPAHNCTACPIGEMGCISLCDWDVMPDELIRTFAKIVGIFEVRECESEPVKDDPVNHPTHYTSGGIECLDAIAASMTAPEYEGFLKGQIMKYVWRYRLKGKPVEDLKKAAFYLDRLIQAAEKDAAV